MVVFNGKVAYWQIIAIRCVSSITEMVAALQIIQLQDNGMRTMQIQNWKIGDVFLVQTSDGQYVVGQVVAQEQDVLNSVSCAFFDYRVNSASQLHLQKLSMDLVFSVLFVTRDFLDSGKWQVVDNCPVLVTRQWLPYEQLRSQGYVGAKVIGTSNVREFLNAFFCLSTWDDWKDPTYLDKLLMSPGKKPAGLKYKTSK